MEDIRLLKFYVGSAKQRSNTIISFNYTNTQLKRLRMLLRLMKSHGFSETHPGPNH